MHKRYQTCSPHEIRTFGGGPGDMSSTEDKPTTAVDTLERVGEVRAALVVVEFQVAVVGERHCESEGPVSGRRLEEVEVRLPPV